MRSASVRSRFVGSGREGLADLGHSGPQYSLNGPVVVRTHPQSASISRIGRVDFAAELAGVNGDLEKPW
jgi:hypothetical protein